MQLTAEQKRRLLWSANAYVVCFTVLCALTVPVLICSYVFNLVAPYNAVEAPTWAYVLLYTWLAGAVAPLAVAVLLSSNVRCPECGEHFGKQRPEIKSAASIYFAPLYTFRHHRIQCYCCGHQFELA